MFVVGWPDTLIFEITYGNFTGGGPILARTTV